MTESDLNPVSVSFRRAVWIFIIGMSRQFAESALWTISESIFGQLAKFH